jgi:hypothetical protein
MNLSLIELLEKYDDYYVFYTPYSYRKKLEVCYLGFYVTDPYGGADAGHFSSVSEELKPDDLKRLENLVTTLDGEWSRNLHIELCLDMSKEVIVLTLKKNDTSYTKAKKVKQITVSKEFFSEIKSI